MDLLAHVASSLFLNTQDVRQNCLTKLTKFDKKFNKKFDKKFKRAPTRGPWTGRTPTRIPRHKHLQKMAQVQMFFNKVFEKHTDVELGNVNVIVLLVLQNSQQKLSLTSPVLVYIWVHIWGFLVFVQLVLFPSIRLFNPIESHIWWIKSWIDH